MGGRRIPFVPMWADEISIAHVQHLVVIIVCDWWPGLSVEVRCLGSGLPAVKLSHAEQRCIQVCETVNTQMSDGSCWVWNDNFLFTGTDVFVPNHQQASIRLCLQKPPAALHISLFCIFGHFTLSISKQPKFRLKTKTTSKWWFLFLNEVSVLYLNIKVCCKALEHLINNYIQS